MKTTAITKNKTQYGFSLIELMISVTIGSLLILAAAYAFQEAKKTYVINDNVARLQEQAQFVLDTLEEDIRHTNFWGRHNSLNALSLNTTATSATIANDCGDPADPSFTGWALKITESIHGTNNVYPPWGTTNDCVKSDEYVTGTDTLVVRHAASRIVDETELEDGKLYIASIETPSGIIFEGPAKPSGLSSIASFNELLAHGYYVRKYSFDSTDAIPMLMRRTLVDGGTSPAVKEQEFAYGVEDFQIEFGVDTSDLTSNQRGSINRYVSPDNTILDDDSIQVRSVRVWLLMRAQYPEQNFTNDTTYSYGDHMGANAYKPDDNFRRLLVSRTIQIRNMEQ